VAAVLTGAGLRGASVHQLADATGLPADRLRGALAGLRDTGRAALSDDLWFAAGHLDDAEATAREAFAAGPLPMAALRDAWGVGRRHALAIAAHPDARGVTARAGDRRVLRRGSRDP
jgi:hypothetical protein